MTCTRTEINHPTHFKTRYGPQLLTASVAHNAPQLALLADAIITSVNIQVFGLGQHVTDISPKENIVAISLLSNCTASLTILAAVWSKTSFAMTLLRITGHKTKVAVWVVIISINLAMSVNVVTTWVQCDPVEKGLDREVPGRCWDPRVNVYYGIFAGGEFDDLFLVFFSCV